MAGNGNIGINSFRSLSMINIASRYIFIEPSLSPRRNTQFLKTSTALILTWTSWSLKGKVPINEELWASSLNPARLPAPSELQSTCLPRESVSLHPHTLPCRHFLGCHGTWKTFTWLCCSLWTPHMALVLIPVLPGAVCFSGLRFYFKPLQTGVDLHTPLQPPSRRAAVIASLSRTPSVFPSSSFPQVLRSTQHSMLLNHRIIGQYGCHFLQPSQ